MSKSSLKEAVEAMRNRLDPTSRTPAAHDFRHASQKQGESVADFIRRLEQLFKLAYGREEMSDETRETLLHSQGLLYNAPAVSGSHAYSELCLAARNEEKRLAELARRRQYMHTQPLQSSPAPLAPRSTAMDSDAGRRSGVRPPPGGGNSSGPAVGVRRCYSCGRPGHLARACPNQPREGGQQGGTRQVQTLGTVNRGPPQHSSLSPALTSYLLSSNSDSGVRQVRIDDEGSRQQHVEVLLAGVPVRGVIDSGADITIMGGELFCRVAAATRMKRKQLYAPDRIPTTYDWRPFTLDGKVNIDISFDDVTVNTPVYIKVDAPEPLLLSEGVCRQLKVISYHPLVSGKKPRKPLGAAEPPPGEASPPPTVPPAGKRRDQMEDEVLRVDGEEPDIQAPGQRQDTPGQPGRKRRHGRQQQQGAVRSREEREAPPMAGFTPHPIISGEMTHAPHSVASGEMTCTPHSIVSGEKTHMPHCCQWREDS